MPLLQLSLVTISSGLPYNLSISVITISNLSREQQLIRTITKHWPLTLSGNNQACNGIWDTRASSKKCESHDNVGYSQGVSYDGYLGKNRRVSTSSVGVRNQIRILSLLSSKKHRQIYQRVNNVVPFEKNLEANLNDRQRFLLQSSDES